MPVRLILPLVLVLAGLAAPRPSSAQDVERIAAVVNEEMITVRDLEARLRMALLMSNVQDNLENRRRAVPQVLRKMVDERIQLQEAGRVKVTVPADEINRAIANVERQGRMPPGTLLGNLSKAGVDTDVVRDQIRADIAWMKVINRVIAVNVKVGEEEINDRLEILRQQMGKPEYLLAEIVLTADSPQQEEEARRLGERLLDQLRAGAPFPALARQFSQAPSAGAGGMLGWVNEENLDDDLRTAVRGLTKGQTSPMIRVAGGVGLVTVVDTRVAGQAGPSEEVISAVNLFFPKPASGQVSKEQLRAKAAELTAPLRSCQEFEELGRKVGSQKSNRYDNLRKADMPGPLQALLAPLPINKASQPADADDGLMVYMVCSRSTQSQAGGLPNRESIRKQIEDERVDLQGKRLLRDLRRAAFVDFRL